jgi:cold shock CspA family protein
MDRKEMKRMRGTMIYFNEEKDVGYIRSDEGERVQVLREDFLPGHAPVGRCNGLEVEFSLSESEEPVAVEVSVVADDNPRRARRRSSRR